KVLGMWCSWISPLPSADISGFEPDPEGYAAARNLWLAQTQSPATPAPVLDNAAYFFEEPDKPLAESLLVRANLVQPDVKWSLRLGRLYAEALSQEANSGFAQSVRRTLAQSKDVQMLNATGQYLMIGGEAGATMAITYFQRAVDIDPYFVPAHDRLIQMKSRK